VLRLHGQTECYRSGTKPKSSSNPPPISKATAIAQPS
jgi:hypothetical protein